MEDITIPVVEATPNQVPIVPAQQQQDVLSSSDDNGDDDYLSSGTSSYESDHNGKQQKQVQVVNDEEIKSEKELVDRQLMEMMDDFEEPSVSSYAKFKTQHEIDPEQVEKYAPPKPELDELDQIVEFGTITNFIDDGTFHSIVIVKPQNPQQIYDLDNIISLKSKEVIGFVLDLVGHITAPLYSVRLYPAFVESLKAKNVELRNQLVDQQVFLVSKCLKVINAQLPAIMQKKGCDASNIYDEEIPAEEQEHSDDEKEKEAKRALKKKKQLKRKGGADDVMSESSEEEGEEGEIKGGPTISNHHHSGSQHQRGGYKRFNQTGRGGNQFQRGGRGGNQVATIPQYSTSVPLNYQQPNQQQNNFSMNQNQFQPQPAPMNQFQQNLMIQQQQQFLLHQQQQYNQFLMQQQQQHGFQQFGMMQAQPQQQMMFPQQPNFQQFGGNQQQQQQPPQ